ncbi:MAG: DUF11 domain-containing protein [Lentisphaeria bacterium]|nr:DUF11 domain-containing protein [Lentisphaeria bacterium]
MQRERSFARTMVAASMAAALALVAGCCSLDEPTPAPKPAPVPVAKPAPPPPLPSGTCPVVGRDGGNVFTRQAIPTGTASTSIILMEKVAPEVVNVGQDFEYHIKVTNLTACELDEVVVTETIAQGLNYKSSDPNASRSGDLLTWNLGTLPGNSTRILKVRAAANGPGTFTDCARVTYKEKLCITVKAVEPKLTLDKSAPAEVLLCDIIPLKLTVTNPGSGVANNVVITDPLPAGLKTVDGQTNVTINVGNLNPGESKSYTVNTQATRTGSFENKAVAKADGGLSDDAASTTVVKQPVLTITKTADQTVYEGRPINYKVTVTNKGDAVAANTVLTDTLPSGVSFVSATDGGQAAGGMITWNLGSMAPNASKTVGITVKAVSQGTVVNRAETKAVCAAAVAATAQTVVKGIPAVLLEVIDLEDPIEVGGQETYVITVTNQGSMADTNIAITCTLEDSQSYVSSSGATQATATGQTVRFAPLASLAPKAKAEWRVVVKATKAGDVRFSVEMNTAQLQRPVNETESTNQY